MTLSIILQSLIATNFVIQDAKATKAKLMEELEKQLKLQVGEAVALAVPDTDIVMFVRKEKTGLNTFNVKKVDV
jgi:hypothetical protein